VVLGITAGRFVERSEPAQRALASVAQSARVAIPLAVVGLVVLAFAVGRLDLGRVSNALGEALAVTAESSGLLLLVLVAGVYLGSQGARSPIVLGGIAIGFAAVALVQALPGDLGFLGDALRFEVPKTVHYWMSGIAAAGAASALATAWSEREGTVPWPARAVAVAAFVVVAGL